MRDFDHLKELIIDYVEQLDEEQVLKIAEQALNEGMEPVTLLNQINKGMNRVGELYESKEYYIADLIMAGLIFKEVLELDKMKAHFHSSTKKIIGKVVVGTAKGDIHDIGKDIFRGMLETNGFMVIDLGVDVPEDLFVKKVLEHKPDIIGISGVLTNTIEAMREVVDALQKAGLRDQVKVILGGDYLTKEGCIYAGADDFAKEASDGVMKCRSWMNSINNQGAVENGQSDLS